MKKIRILSFLLACLMFACAFIVSASAATIDFIPKTKGDKIYGIPAGSTARTVGYAYYNTIVSVYDKSGNAIGVGSDKTVGTGYKIKINSTVYTAVVMGDIDGDGRIRALDYAAIKRAYMGSIADLSDLSKAALGIEDGGRISPLHYIKVKRAVMGTYNMNQDYMTDPYDPGASESGWTSGWI